MFWDGWVSARSRSRRIAAVNPPEDFSGDKWERSLFDAGAAGRAC
jgi:hypothetical protein